MNADDIGDAYVGAAIDMPAWAAGMRVGQHSLCGRQAKVALWYPASTGAVRSGIEYGGEPAAFRVDDIALDAAPVRVERRRPLLLLAGAAGADAFELAWLGAQLARSGNVVAATDGAHTAADTCRTLAALASLVSSDASLAGCLDTRRHAVAGFDLGAIAALLSAGARLADAPRSESLRDPRVCAIALLNPCPVGLLAPLRRGEIELPVHVVVSVSDRVAPPREHGVRLAASIRGARLTRLAAPAGHHVFRGEATAAGRRSLPEQTIDAAVVHRGSLHECTATLVDALVSRVLAEGDEGAPQWR